jgi:hypothetical protein
MVNILTQHLPPHGYDSLSHASKNLRSHIDSYLIIKKQRQLDNNRLSCCLPDIHVSELYHIWQSGFDTGQQDCNRFFQQTRFLHTKIAKADILYASSFKESVKVAFALGYMRCLNGYDQLPNQMLINNYNKYCPFLSVNEQTSIVNDLEIQKFFKSLENGLKVHILEDEKIVFMLKPDDLFPLLSSKKHPKIPFCYIRESQHLNKSQQKQVDKYLRSIIKENKDDTLVYNHEYKIISEICRPGQDLQIESMNSFFKTLFK